MSAQTVTLTAVEDDDAVTDTPTTLTHTASGADYDSVAVVNLMVTVTENDTVGSDAVGDYPDGDGRF